MVLSRLLIVSVLLVLPLPARAQQFASVVIKPSVSSASGASRLQFLPNGDLVCHSVPIIDLIAIAYAVPANPTPRLASLPEWAVGQRFDIQAKTSASLKLDTKDIQVQRRTIAILLQKLLNDDFGLVLKVKKAITPVYALTQSGNDQKLTRSTVSPRDCILDTDAEGCHSFEIGFGHPLNARGVDMFDLAHYLENWTDLPVVDRTATTGLSAMHSQGWRPMNLPPPPPGASGTGAEFASLSTLSAVLRSFGLQLDRQQDSLPFYVVERLHQPNER